MRFILIDKIDRLEPGKLAEGHKIVAHDEDYFRDHFPGYPIVPGVLVLESLAQLGGRLVEASVRESSGTPRQQETPAHEPGKTVSRFKAQRTES